MKILLLPDLKGWAFANIAKAIQKFGTHDYDIEYEHQFRKERAKELPKEKIDFDKYDVIVAFAPWMVWSNLPKEKTICICHEDFEMDHWNINGYKKVFVTTDISLEYIKSKTRAVKVQAGYDSSIFNSSYICKALSKPLKIGWVGAWSGHVDKKGYEKYYLPLGKWFDLRPHLKEIHYAESQEDYAKYYQGIDVLLCTSNWEGYPLPIIEASACGIPVISTRVGIAPEVLPSDQIVERSVEAFRKRLEKGNFEVGDVFGWKWEDKIKEWEREFE